jgi:hypothetical protein
MSMAAPVERPSRARIVELLTEGLGTLLAERGEKPPADLGEGTRLAGAEAVLTSLGLVSLIVELEQTLEEQYGLCLTIADERAMSRRHGPFRSVGSLADYVHQLIQEQ